MLNIDMQAATMALAGIIVILHKKIRKLETNYTFFMQDETGASVEAKLRDDVDKLHNLQGTLDMIHQTQKDIMAVQNHCFRKIGFVKYNAFDKCLYGMSEEERESLDNALNYSGDMQAVQRDLEE